MKLLVTALTAFASILGMRTTTDASESNFSPVHQGAADELSDLQLCEIMQQLDSRSFQVQHPDLVAMSFNPNSR